jgi:ABC-type lipoprotein release transport system permease subunit
MAVPFKYSRRSLLVRRVSNSMTAGAIALVVGVFVIAMALVAGLAETVNDTASPGNLIVMRRAATSESASTVTLDQLQALQYLPAIRRDAGGTPLVSPELAEQVIMPSPGSNDSVPVRGVLPAAFAVHDKVHVIAGRMLKPELDEVIIGQRLVGRYPGASLGSAIRFGRREWTVVGVFAAAGSSFESEIWADMHSLQEDSRRGPAFNSIRLKLVPGADVPGLIQRIAADPRINLQAETESAYYLEQSVFAANLRTLGLVVAGIMAFSAMFAAMNTMYAAVAARTAEIGTLRALGFSPRAIMTSFLGESSVLALVAGAVGVLLALPINGYAAKFNGPFSTPTLAFNFHVTPAVVVQALIFALLIGAAGGALPARQAMRVTVASALRRT